jgi:hypothetical protein
MRAQPRPPTTANLVAAVAALFLLVGAWVAFLVGLLVSV